MALAVALLACSFHFNWLSSKMPRYLYVFVSLTVWPSIMSLGLGGGGILPLP